MLSKTSHDEPPQSNILVPSNTAHSFTQSLLEANGVPSSNAAIIAAALTLADLRGVDTHGTNRLPSYMARIREGVLSASSSPTIENITPCVALIDGHNSFGFLSAHMGMAAAISMAQTFGIGMV